MNGDLGRGGLELALGVVRRVPGQVATIPATKTSNPTNRTSCRRRAEIVTPLPRRPLAPQVGFQRYE
jgi:hypothetical protein